MSTRSSHDVRRPRSARAPLRRRTLIATALAAAVAATASCGARIEQPVGAMVSVVNCGATHQYPTPTAAVAYDVSTIEKMFALGLADRMKGIVLPKTVHGVIGKSPYRADYAKVPILSDGVLNQETVVSAKADWVFAGWQAGFSPTRGVTPQSLSKLGINSYLQEETCYNYGNEPARSTAKPLADTYADLANLGAIFHVPERATKLIDALTRRERDLRARADQRESKPAVFVYDSGTTEPYTAGRRAAVDEVVTLAGGRSVTGDVDARWTTVGWESVVAAQPDVLVVVDYDKQPVQQKIDYLRTQSPLKDSPALQHNRIRVMDYGELVASPRNLDAAASLADYLDSVGMKDGAR